jgi:hypothetical protein
VELDPPAAPAPAPRATTPVSAPSTSPAPAGVADATAPTAESPPASPPPAAVSGATSPRRPRRGLVLAVVGAVVLAAGGTAGALYLTKDDKDKGASASSAPSQTSAGSSNSTGETPTTQATPADPHRIPASLTTADIQRGTAGVIRDNTVALQNGDFDAAWAALSPGRQDFKEKHGGYDEWQTRNADLQFAFDESRFKVAVSFVNRATGEILVNVTGGITSTGSYKYDCYCGLTWVQYINGQYFWDAGNDTYPRRKRFVGDCRFIGYTSASKRGGDCNRGQPRSS